MRALIGLGFGLGCVLAATACDDGGGDDTTAAASTTSATGATTTTGGAMAMGDPITFMDGWAPLDGNSYMIQGAFYTFGDMTDGGGSIIAPVGGATDFSMSGTEVCAEGTAGQVMPGADGNPAYSTYWGAAIGFNLRQEADGPALPYDAGANGVAGFSFVVGGTNPIPAGGELRFNINVADPDTHNYCAKILQPGPNTFMLSELPQSCWDPPAAAPTPDPANLEALHWQYVTNAMASYDFNLCISDLRVIPAGG